MCPINIICPHCGRDQLVEPEVIEDETARCSTCKRFLHDEEEECDCFQHTVGNAGGVYSKCPVHSKLMEGNTFSGKEKKEIVWIRIVKRSGSQVVMFSEDSKNWISTEEAFNFTSPGDYDLRLAIEQGPSVASLLVKK